MTFKRQLIKEALSRVMPVSIESKEANSCGALQYSYTVLYILHFIALHWIILHYIALYCIGLHCKIGGGGWSELLPDINHLDWP